MSSESSAPKAVFLNPFIQATSHIFTTTIFEQPVKDKAFLRAEYPYTTGQVALIIGVTGALYGHVVISTSMECALHVAAKMMMEEKLFEFDEYARSALGELANMITANAMISLAAAGYLCDITPPSVITGTGMKVSCPPNIKTLVMVMKFPFGDIDLNLSLAESKAVDKNAFRREKSQ